jgi:acetyl-CoA acetyltransferase
MKEVVIVSACRTAIGAFGGTLRDTHATDIARATMAAAIERAGIDPAGIDDVRFGCCMEPADALNARGWRPCWRASRTASRRSPSTGSAFRAWKR